MTGQRFYPVFTIVKSLSSKTKRDSNEINNDYGVGLKEVFSKKFQELGGQIVDTESFLEGRTDFRSQIAKIKAANPQGIYLIGYTEMIQIFKQLKELAVNAQVMSTIMLYDPDLVKKCEGAANGAILTAWAYDPHSQEGATKQFVERFKARYGHDPDVFAAQSYDALFLLKLAMEKRGTSPQDIRDGLYSIKDYPGVSGETTFTSTGDVIKPIRILEVRLRVASTRQGWNIPGSLCPMRFFCGNT